MGDSDFPLPVIPPVRYRLKSFPLTSDFYFVLIYAPALEEPLKSLTGEKKKSMFYLSDGQAQKIPQHSEILHYQENNSICSFLQAASNKK